MLATALCSCFDMDGRMPVYEVSFDTSEKFENYLSDFDTVLDDSARTFVLMNSQNDLDVIKYSYKILATDSFEFFHQLHKKNPTRDYQVSVSNVTAYLNVHGYDVECFYFVEEIGRFEKSELVCGNAEVTKNESGFIYTINISYQNISAILLTVRSNENISKENINKICELIIENLKIVEI